MTTEKDIDPYISNQKNDIEIEQELKINSLLVKFEKGREQLEEMIKEVEDIRKKLDKILPPGNDFRYLRLLEEKVKAITSFHNMILEIRKEIMRSIRDEIEMRRRLKEPDSGLKDLEEMLDVRRLAATVERFQRDQTKRLDKFKLDRTEAKVDGIEIPEQKNELKKIEGGKN